MSYFHKLKLNTCCHKGVLPHLSKVALIKKRKGFLLFSPFIQWGRFPWLSFFKVNSKIVFSLISLIVFEAQPTSVLKMMELLKQGYLSIKPGFGKSCKYKHLRLLSLIPMAGKSITSYCVFMPMLIVLVSKPALMSCPILQKTPSGFQSTNL